EVLRPPRLVEIAIEHDIGGLRQLALDQVHQQEGEIVQHVAGGDLGIEFDGVEQHRRALEQHDIAEVQIAVTPTYQASTFARGEQRANALQCTTRRVGERAHRLRREKLGGSAELRIVLRGDLGEVP